MSVPWYARPIEPSRFAFLVPPLIALVILGVCVSNAVFLASARPSGFQGPMLLGLGCALCLKAAYGFVRRRREPSRCPGFSILGTLLGGVALMVLAIPPLLWPQLQVHEPVPSALVPTRRVVWCAVGLLLASAVYAVARHRHSRAERLPS